MIPIFVKGDLRFSIELSGSDGPMLERVSFTHQNISVSGVSGLPWGNLRKDVHFGKRVKVTVTVTPNPPEGSTNPPAPWTFDTQASITREFTYNSDSMGLRFIDLEADVSKRLAQSIAKEGYFPTEYLRKYPRIPSSPLIQTFPLRVMIMPEEVGALPISCEVENLSPNGVLASSENQATLRFAAGQRLQFLLEPRGWFPMPIQIEGIICRITEEMHPRTGNLVRHFGIKFARIDDYNRMAFVDLLKDIVERLKKYKP